MSHDWMRLSLLAVTLCAAIPQTQAQDLPAALAACRAEQDDAKRLACYDRAVENLGQGSPAAGEPVAVAGQSPEEQFGHRGTLAREEQDRARFEARKLGELHAIVTAISTRADGTLVMTLDNGQVWQQNRPDSFFRLQAGEQIKIEPAVLGSFMMINSSKRTSRVTRVK